jgi:branched-chain amino acid transport system substrate-binding protein
MKKTIIWVVIIIVVIGLGWLILGNRSVTPNGSPIKIGWISDLTGPNSKYGSIEAARIAVEEINNGGGINGRAINLIEENGLCDTKTTLGAVSKLINIDKVGYILGGHCSTETIAAAPVAEKNKVILLASISSSPVISDAGDYIFRTSSISTQQSGLVAQYAISHGIKKIGVVYENKEYPKPIAEELKKSFEQKGGIVPAYEGYATEEKDFRSILLKVKASGVDAIFVSPQSPDKAALLLKQIKDLKMGVVVFGNEQVGSTAVMDIAGKDVVEGVIYGEPAFDTEDQLTKAFITAYSKKNNTDGIPYGIWTAESYDAVKILTQAIGIVGDDIEKVKGYLYTIKNYKGASGYITINKKGDGVRNYSLKTIQDGKPVVLSAN